jgi:tRNA(Ile2) C34 agmatinyltransferase TiaS
VRLSRREVRDHINYRKNDRWRSYRFYRALQRLKSPMHNICEISEPRDFRVFQCNRRKADIGQSIDVSKVRAKRTFGETPTSAKRHSSMPSVLWRCRG